MMIRIVLPALAAVSLSLGLLMTYARAPAPAPALDACLEQLDGALAGGETTAGRAEARRAYLAALERARATGSADGVLQVAEAFAALGDRSVAEQCLVIAARLAGDSRDGQVVERVRAASERLEERLHAGAGEGDWRR